jgi:hypothetical protein
LKILKKINFFFIDKNTPNPLKGQLHILPKRACKTSPSPPHPGPPQSLSYQVKKEKKGKKREKGMNYMDEEANSMKEYRLKCAA